MRSKGLSCDGEKYAAQFASSLLAGDSAIESPSPWVTDAHRHLLAHGGPEIAQGLACALAPALDPAARQHDGVHGAGARAADAVDEDAAVGDQLRQHTPGERAMGPAALQREIDMAPNRR